jgi:uncharacterized protein
LLCSTCFSNMMLSVDIATIKDYRLELNQLCLTYQVKHLALFGSAARTDFDSKHSDLDFVVEFEAMSAGEHADAYFGLLFALEDMFKLPVDLVEKSAIRNPYVRQTIEKDQQTLYASA